MQRARPVHTDQRFGRRWGRHRGSVLFPEQEAKRRTRRGEGPRRPEREVDLEGVRQEEDPVKRWAGPHVDVMGNVVIGVHALRPVARDRPGFEVGRIRRARSMPDHRSSRPSAAEPTKAAAATRSRWATVNTRRVSHGATQPRSPTMIDPTSREQGCRRDGANRRTGSRKRRHGGGRIVLR